MEKRFLGVDAPQRNCRDVLATSQGADRFSVEIRTRTPSTSESPQKPCPEPVLPRFSQIDARQFHEVQGCRLRRSAKIAHWRTSHGPVMEKLHRLCYTHL
jgi:hypothetical protein